MQTQIRWAGHLIRMPDHRLPMILLYGELEKDKRSQCGQKKRYKDSLKTSLKAFEIDQDTWEELAQNRSTWRSTVKKSASSCEKRRNAAAQQRRVARKSRIGQNPSTVIIPCPYCSRTFTARIGLISHLRTIRHGHNSN